MAFGAAGSGRSAAVTEKPVEIGSMLIGHRRFVNQWPLMRPGVNTGTGVIIGPAHASDGNLLSGCLANVRRTSSRMYSDLGSQRQPGHPHQ